MFFFFLNFFICKNIDFNRYDLNNEERIIGVDPFTIFLSCVISEINYSFKRLVE